MAVYNLTDKIPSSGGTITAATWSKNCITNVSTSNVPSWITTGGTASKTLTLHGDSWTGTTEKKATITVNYKASGTDCSNSLIVTQEGGSGPDGKIKVQIILRNGVTSPYLSFKTASNTQVLGVPRYSVNTTQAISISNGTCTKLGFSELGGGATRISITLQKQGNAPISLLSNANIPSSTATYLTLLNSFDTSNYNDSNTCTLSIDIG